MSILSAYISSHTYFFQVKNGLYKFTPSECLLEEVLDINVINDNLCEFQYKNIESSSFFIEELFTHHDISNNMNGWVHINYVFPIDVDEKISQINETIEMLISKFSNQYSGITIGFRCSNMILSNINLLQLIADPFVQYREKYIETYPYLYLSEELLNKDMIDYIKLNKCCWEIQLTNSNELCVGCFDNKITNFQNFYTQIKTSTGYNNKGIYALINPKTTSYLEMFNYFYQIGYGYPISIDIDDLFISSGDVDIVINQYLIFIDFLIDCISGLKFGELFSFFSGRSKLSNIIKAIINFPDKNVRPELSLFCPVVYQDKSIYYNSLSTDLKWIIGDVNGEINYTKIRKITDVLNGNAHFCKECNINHYCAHIFAMNNIFLELKTYYMSSYSCQLTRKIVELAFYFCHRAQLINSEAVNYSCAMHW